MMLVVGLTLIAFGIGAAAVLVSRDEAESGR